MIRKLSLTPFEEAMDFQTPDSLKTILFSGTFCNNGIAASDQFLPIVGQLDYRAILIEDLLRNIDKSISIYPSRR